MKRIGGWHFLAVFLLALTFGNSLWAGTIRLMSSNQLPKKVLVVNTPGTESFVKGLFFVIRNIHDVDGLVGADSFKLHVVDSTGSLRTPERRARFFDAPSGIVENLVEVNPALETGDIWMQDFGEFCTYSEGEKASLAIFDSGRGRGLEGFPKWFADNWGLNFQTNPNKAGTCGDYGGNIEVTPENIFYHGDTMTEKCRRYFLENGYQDREIELATKWLAVGHIDEYLTIIPTRSSPCGYSIVRSDPWNALELVKGASPEDFAKMPQPFRSFLPKVQAALKKMEGAHVEGDRGFLQKIIDFLKGNSGGSPITWEEMQFIQLNMKIGEIIEENTGRFISGIRRITGKEDLEIPVMAWPNLFKGENPENPTSCVAYTPGVVNHLILRDHLIVPDPFFPPFRKIVEARFRSQGNRVHFLDDLAYHNLMGEVHCGTNVQRDPERVFITPQAAAAVSALRANFSKLHRDTFATE